MTKQEFIRRLESGLSGLPREDREERLTFYEELIADGMEDGLSEEEAVAKIGSVEGVVEGIIADTPLTSLLRERVRPRRALSAFEIVLLAVGSPIWLTLLIAGVAVILSVYAVLFAALIALWAVLVAVGGSAVAGVAAGVLFLIKGKGNPLPGLAVLGAGIACGGLTIYFFYVCRAATKGLLRLCGGCFLFLKTRFMRKEAAA